MILRLYSVVGFAEPALPPIGRTPDYSQTLPRGSTHSNPFGVITSGRREIERVHPRLGDSALSYNPTSIGDIIVSSLLHPEDPTRAGWFRNVL